MKLLSRSSSRLWVSSWVMVSSPCVSRLSSEVFDLKPTSPLPGFVIKSGNCGHSGTPGRAPRFGSGVPAVTEDGQKVPGLKFGQPRVMARLPALTMFHHLIDG